MAVRWISSTTAKPFDMESLRCVANPNKFVQSGDKDTLKIPHLEQTTKRVKLLLWFSKICSQKYVNQESLAGIFNEKDNSTFQVEL